MDFSSALPTFVITLREGVEAALVVGIVLAYLKKANQSYLIPWVYGGVMVGILASGLIGLFFTELTQGLTIASPKYAPVIEPLLKGSMTGIAIAMLTWMLIWMTQQARLLKSQVEGEIGAVLKQADGAGWGVFSLVCVAVLREGFETVLFIAANWQQGFAPVLGGFAGLVGAVGIGVLLFQWGVKINLRLFFQGMGVLLLLIVSGLVISALKSFDAAVGTLAQVNPQFAAVCFYPGRSCILGPLVWDATDVLPDNQFPGVVLKALLGYRQKLYLVQAIAYCLFLTTTGFIYFQSLSEGVSTKTHKSGEASQPN